MEIIILKKEETNAHFDARKQFDGGGYHQPEITFRYGDWTGTFRNTSCGRFGTRYYVTVSDGKHSFNAYWGSMIGKGRGSSNFPERFPVPSFYEDFKKRFDLTILTELQADIDWFCVSNADRDWYVEHHPSVRAKEEKRIAREKALLAEYGVAV